MHEVKNDDIVFICGKRGCGKSTFLKWLLGKLSCRVAIWDTNWEYSTQGFAITHSINEFCDALNRFGRVIYQPIDKSTGHFNQFCGIILQTNNIVLVVEEVERHATSYFIPPNLKTIIDIGRHKGIGLICTARRTMRTNPDIPYNANHVIIFKQHRPQDLEYMATFCGSDVWKLHTSPDYYYAWYDGSTLTIHRPV